jgi:hypothetical protein
MESTANPRLKIPLLAPLDARLVFMPSLFWLSCGDGPTLRSNWPLRPRLIWADGTSAYFVEN